MTAVVAREAFGAEFVGAEGFLNSPTYGLPPQFMFDALQDCIAQWQAGTMDVPSFDEPVRAGRAGYAALVGVPVDSVAMGGNVSAALGTGRRRDSATAAGWRRWPANSPAPVSRSPRRPAGRDDHRVGA